MFLRDKKQLKFCVVEFLKDKSVEVVPKLWITKLNGADICFWPDSDNKRFCIVNEVPPEDKWKPLKVIIHRHKGN
jgi:hypothetical protein